MNKKKHVNTEDLEQIVYINLSETPTNIFYFAPSTKYAYFSKLKNNKIEEQEKKNDEFYKQYLINLKNSERFYKTGSQTLNPFKRNQIVSTTESYDAPKDEKYNKSISALNWQIEDAKREEKNKKDDEAKMFHKKFEKRVQKELKNKLLNTTNYLDSLDQTETTNKSFNQSDGYSITDTNISSSIQAPKRPKVKTLRNESEGGSQSIDKSKKLGDSPNNSSTFLNNTNTKGGLPSSETGTHISKLLMSNTRIKKSLEEAIPSSLNNPLKYVERLLAQNQYHFKQIAYKSYPIEEAALFSNNKVDEFEDNEEKEKKRIQRQKELELIIHKDTNPDIKYLFSFKGDIIIKDEKYVVNCLDWNPFNQDLLAAAYGVSDIDDKKGGYLLFWTLKNQYPERVIKTPRGLTSCNFSKKNPYYIVCADYTGEIMVFDLRLNTDIPIADSKEVKDKHTDIVWEVKWIERSNDKNEMIVSISSDGKVKEWLLKKGLEVNDLMHMKKTTTFPDSSLNPFSKYDNSTKESMIFRDANGLSFDFPNNDTSIYYISLEECTINKCRISYKDTYIETYHGHQGPVYKVRCNPFDPNIFLTCSYDWTIKIWNTKHYKPLLSCKSMKKTHQINDIEWSPYTSTIFACVIDDGTVEVWDLYRGSGDPVAVERSANNIPKKCIKFSRNSKVIATGDSDFNIEIFKIYNLEHGQVRLNFYILILIN